jgi:hypothetical protein
VHGTYVADVVMKNVVLWIMKPMKELEGEIADERDGEHPEPDESTPLIQYPAQSRRD